MQIIRHMSIGLVVLIIMLPVARGADGPRELTMQEAVTLALQHNPALREAKGREAAAKAQIERARSAQQVQVRIDSRFTEVGTVPEVQLSPSAPAISLGSRDTLVTDFGAQKVLYSGGRLEALVRQATSSAQAVQVTNERTRQVVVFNAERAFLTLLTAQRAQGVAQQALDTARAHQKVAQARLDARAAPRFDVLRAEVEVEAAQSDVTRAASDLEVAQAAVQQALGIDDQTFIAADSEPQLNIPVPVVEALLKRAQALRPELRALDWQRRAAEAAIAAAKGERLPTVSLQGGYEMVNPESLMKTSGWSVTAAASLPIFDGGFTRAKQKEAVAQRDQVEAARASLQNTVVAEVKQAHARLTAAVAQIDSAKKEVALAEEALRIANVRYEAGVATPTEIADAQTSLTRARLRLTRALNDAGIAGAEVQLATGAMIYTQTEPVKKEATP